MPCFRPLKGYRAKEVNPSGKRGIVFNKEHGFLDLPVTLACGQCSGCRLERSRQWAIRCVHEAELWPENSYLTLTYDPEKRPVNGSLNHRHVQLFMKRLRKKLAPKKVRFFMCGEYGDENGHPHYHMILFNHDFEDKILWKQNANGDNVYISEQLASLWQLGFCSLGAVTFQSAAYVARYVLKKVTGPTADDHYRHDTICPVTGEITTTWRAPEYPSMSKKPGIASGWLDRFSNDVYPSDTVVLSYKPSTLHRPPKFYDRRLEETSSHLHREIKTARKRRAKIHAWNSTPDRLRVRETVHLAKINRLKRIMQ